MSATVRNCLEAGACPRFWDRLVSCPEPAIKTRDRVVFSANTCILLLDRRPGLGESTVSIEPHPTTANCRRLLERGDHVLIGVSPFNSKFNQSYLTRLFTWAATSFDRFTVALPGEREAALALEAAGTPAVKAARKTRHELNRNTRTIYAALDAAGVARNGDTLIRVSDFAADRAYRSMVDTAEATYRDNPVFRTACQETSAMVVRAGHAHRPEPWRERALAIY
ncbi:MAG TPA: tRNA-dependent cyclodipeptide synthase [Gemmataceae bacterium]|jgi:tRNA-dependent cyclodipeptide synthase|nr:tRNA-dependent cyclodipeptide synthase [Gemmataceae bacterium]